jgi:hypothetical protein
MMQTAYGEKTGTLSTRRPLDIARQVTEGQVRVSGARARKDSRLFHIPQ